LKTATDFDLKMVPNLGNQGAVANVLANSLHGEAGVVEQGEAVMADSKATTGTAIDGGLVRRQPLIAYFVIAYAVTWFVEGLFVLSRDGSGLLAFKAPMGFAMATGIATSLGPASAAFIVTGLTEGREGVNRLLRRIVQWRVGIFWFLFILVGLPLIQTVGTIVLPGIWATATPMNIVPELLSYTVFFVWPALIAGGPLGEEIGWRGYALPHLQELHGPVKASVILGVLWAFWHLPIWFSGQWTVPSVPNIAAYVVWITAVTVIFTWVFNNTGGSVLMAILLHASMDAFPNAILWTHFPDATRMTSVGILNGYLALIIGFGGFALLLILSTRGRLGRRP
jgi:membrane protease YdiL (CAAX protease family)